MRLHPATNMTTDNKNITVSTSFPTSIQQDMRATANAEPMIMYLLHLADDALILSHRNSEWCGHGPILEQDIALTNIALDLLGQARNCYQYAATVMGNDTTEDQLAYWRTEREFYNSLMTEQPNGDWGQTVLRQFLFSAYMHPLYELLQQQQDAQLAAIAAKALKEVTYHLRWSREWVIRLGDGTKESRDRMLQALDTLWCYTGEWFEPAAYEIALSIDIQKIKEKWLVTVTDTLSEATLPLPGDTFMHKGGKTGLHSEHLGYLLATMQYLQRTYPGNEW
jgi:ring-1,2-phenylacetyl-CoA epoxidase subunit PaaC